MNKVINIYDAKTNFSKLVKKAQAGETIYVGAFGSPQVIIAPLPLTKKLNLGVWKNKKKINYDLLEESGAEIAAWLENEQ